MPLSSRWDILGGMKILASVVALVLVGLTGAWLWMDATAQARQDTAGVVITGPVDPQAVTSLGADGQDAVGDDAATGAAPGDGADPGRSASLDQVVTLLGATSDALVARADEARQAEAEAAQARAAEEEREAAEEAEKEAEKAAEKERRAAERAAEEQRRAEPIPVQPAPVAPGGACEWDEDDAEWECDDDDDDWDDR